MCLSATTLMAMNAGASLVQGLGSNASARAQAGQLDAQAASERDTGQAQAQRILRETARRRGAARATIAASGTALDEFALRNEQDIQQAGELDAAMAILSGERQARQSQAEASMVRSSGQNAMLGGILRAAGTYAGWKGALNPPVADGGYGVGTGPVYNGRRRGM